MIFIIFYIYTHIYIFYTYWFPAPILIHIEGRSDNLSWQECHYLLISREKKTSHQLFLNETLYRLLKVFSYSSWKLHWNSDHKPFTGCIMPPNPWTSDPEQLLCSCLLVRNKPTNDHKRIKISNTPYEENKDLLQVGKDFCTIFSYKATLQLLKTLF